MATRYPLAYDLSPRRVKSGTRWLTLRLENIGSEELTGLDVRLHSLDAYGINVYGTGSYITTLPPKKEQVIAFRVAANTTTNVYATVEGWQSMAPFYWETPDIMIIVGQQVAELLNLFAMTEPYPPLGQEIKCEATLRGVTHSKGLRLEFWADTPSDTLEELATIQVEKLSADETARFAAEFTPQEEGAYTLYAYLYDGVVRIGRKTEYIYVTGTG